MDEKMKRAILEGTCLVAGVKSSTKLSKVLMEDIAPNKQELLWVKKVAKLNTFMPELPWMFFAPYETWAFMEIFFKTLPKIPPQDIYDPYVGFLVMGDGTALLEGSLSDLVLLEDAPVAELKVLPIQMKPAPLGLESERHRELSRLAYENTSNKAPTSGATKGTTTSDNKKVVNDEDTSGYSHRSQGKRDDAEHEVAKEEETEGFEVECFFGESCQQHMAGKCPFKHKPSASQGGQRAWDVKETESKRVIVHKSTGADVDEHDRSRRFYAGDSSVASEIPSDIENHGLELNMRLNPNGSDIKNSCKYGQECADWKNKRCNKLHPWDEGYVDLSKIPCSRGSECPYIRSGRKCAYRHDGYVSASQAPLKVREPSLDDMRSRRPTMNPPPMEPRSERGVERLMDPRALDRNVDRREGRNEPVSCFYGRLCTHQIDGLCKKLHPGDAGYAENPFKLKPCSYGKSCPHKAVGRCLFRHPEEDEEQMPHPERERERSSSGVKPSSRSPRRQDPRGLCKLEDACPLFL